MQWFLYPTFHPLIVKKINRNFRKSTKLWSSASQAEKNYTSYKVSNHADSRQKNILRQTFKEAQSHSDQKYRYFKRQHKNKNINDLEKLASENSSDIWAKLKQIGFFKQKIAFQPNLNVRNIRQLMLLLVRI